MQTRVTLTGSRRYVHQLPDPSADGRRHRLLDGCWCDPDQETDPTAPARPDGRQEVIVHHQRR
ncbi:MAG: hypothetical protein OXJ55_15940 [Caldilineaceae bacterium]|nr:hypothetical protein [Caldilineaceae bacterium]